MRTIVVVSAGLSNPSTTKSLADQLANATRTAITARGEDADIVHLELRNLATDLATAMTTGGMLTPALTDAQDAVLRADGLIAVTPVFSASYSGLFKMFFDVLDQGSMENQPVLIAATAGTARHSLVLEFAMRPLFAYLKAHVVPTAVFAATEDFGGELAGELTARVAKSASELATAALGEQNAVAGFIADNLGKGANTNDLQANNNFENLLRMHRG